MHLEWNPIKLECDTNSILGRLYITKCQTRLGDRYMIQSSSGVECLGKNLKWILTPSRDECTEEFYDTFYLPSIEFAKMIARKWVIAASGKQESTSKEVTFIASYAQTKIVSDEMRVNAQFYEIFLDIKFPNPIPERIRLDTIKYGESSAYGDVNVGIDLFDKAIVDGFNEQIALVRSGGKFTYRASIVFVSTVPHLRDMVIDNLMLSSISQ